MAVVLHMACWHATSRHGSGAAHGMHGWYIWRTVILYMQAVKQALHVALPVDDFVAMDKWLARLTAIN